LGAANRWTTTGRFCKGIDIVLEFIDGCGQFESLFICKLTDLQADEYLGK
jgi:hypothetical protein